MKCFVIFNPDDLLSCNLANDVISSCNNYNIHPTLYLGSFGNHTEISVAEHNLQELLKPNLTSGEKGCFISHYLLWKNCYEENVPYLVLEHDVTMKQALPDNILETFDDFLHLDSCGKLQKDQEAFIRCTQTTGPPDIKKFSPTLYNELSWKAFKKTNIPGAYAYIIKPSGAKKLIQAASKIGMLPADVFINAHILNISITEPSIFRLCDFMLDKKNRTKFSSTKNNYGTT